MFSLLVYVAILAAVLLTLRRRLPDPGGLLLYGLVLVCELPGALIRFGQLLIPGMILSSLVPLIFHVRQEQVYTYVFVAGGIWAALPLAWSVLALLIPLDLGARARIGARPAVPEETAAIRQAMGSFFEPVSAPRTWYVVDRQGFSAGVSGDNVFVARWEFATRHLAATVAHELGHRNRGDGRLMLAAYRLSGWSWKTFVGFGLWLTGRLWIGWMYRREYAADAYAHRLGLGEAMIAMLEAHLPGENIAFGDLVTVLPWLKVADHPAIMQRISRLRSLPPAVQPEPKASRLDEPPPDWLMNSRFGRWFTAQREAARQQLIDSGEWDEATGKPIPIGEVLERKRTAGEGQQQG